MEGNKHTHTHTPTVVNKLKIRLLIKEDLRWYGKANFVGKLSDSIHMIPL